MKNNSRLDDLIKEMEEYDQGLKEIEHLVNEPSDQSSIPSQTNRPVSRRMILELVEGVRSAKTDEEVDAIVRRFFKDVPNGKIPVHEEEQAGNRKRGTASAIQLPERMRDSLRRCIDEFLRAVGDLKTSLETIEEVMRNLEPILRAIANYRPEKDERMRSMISDLLRLGYSEAEIRELTQSGKKYTSRISEMHSRDDE